MDCRSGLAGWHVERVPAGDWRSIWVIELRSAVFFSRGVCDQPKLDYVEPESIDEILEFLGN